MQGASNTVVQESVTRSISAERFERLKQQWLAETKYLSSASAIVRHEAYQKIIGMGNSALPFIFREMEREPGHWFWALFAITEANPVPEEHKGNISAMTADWLAWGREHGYLD